LPDIKLNDTLAEMAMGLAGTWLIIVADPDGMLLSFWAAPENKLPPEMLGGFVQTITGTINAFEQSATGFGEIDDIIYTMGFSTILIKPMARGSCFMVIDGPKSVPVGMMRMAANNYAPKVEQALPGYQPRRDGMGTIVP
jgi:hypothetical protein